MVISWFVYILVMLLIAFCCYQKKLHLFEIFYIWMMVWLCDHSASSVLIANLKYIAVGNGASDFWTHFFKRLLLYPLLVVAFYDLYIRIEAKWMRLLLHSGLIVCLASLEFLFIRLGVLVNKGGYSFTYALIEWGLTVLITYISWRWYRTKRLGRDL